MDEEWVTIDGFRGRYEVSNLGRVRSWNNGINRRATPRMLNGRGDEAEYPAVTIHDGPGGEISQTKRIHQLVAVAFLGPKPGPGYEVAHLDGTRDNNNAANLKWVSRAENCGHRIEHGSYGMKLTVSDVRDIRRRLGAREVKVKELAREYGVSAHTITSVRDRKTWRGLD